MAAAAAGINKQVTVAAMEPCIRHGRGANSHAVKVDTLSISLRPTILIVVLGVVFFFSWEGRAVVSSHFGVDCCCVGVGNTGLRLDGVD